MVSGTSATAPTRLSTVPVFLRAHEAAEVACLAVVVVALTVVVARCVAVDAQLAVLVVAVHRTARLVHRQLAVVDVDAVAVGVRVGEQPHLQHPVGRSTEAGRQVAGLDGLEQIAAVVICFFSLLAIDPLSVRHRTHAVTMLAALRPPKAGWLPAGSTSPWAAPSNRRHRESAHRWGSRTTPPARCSCPPVPSAAPAGCYRGRQ